MHTQPVLQKFFRESLPEVHQTRCQALIVAVDAVARGARVTITGWDGPWPIPAFGLNIASNAWIA